MVADLISFAEEIKSDGIAYVILLGMGGSSLAAEVFQKTFGNKNGYPELIVLDSTHPVALQRVQNKINLLQTLFLVSSKSGTTLETISLFRYFWKQVRLAVDKPGHHFVAITDPGTPLEQVAEERGFRRIFWAQPDVGGRYSAFSVFGILPAALIGMDIDSLLKKARIEYEDYALSGAGENPAGLRLGAALGELAADRDKITILASPSLIKFPGWLEQLIAESTGKAGKGIVPVVGEPQAVGTSYSRDRLFVGFFLKEDNCQELEDYMASLKKAGHPVIYEVLADKINLAQNIYRWEVATAVAGAILRIHPFNQPDVQLTKELTQKTMKEEEKGKEQGQFKDTGLFINDSKELTEGLRRWLDQAQSKDYVALQAFLPHLPEIDTALQQVRLELLKRLHLATTLGYGPRFLHSTGQLHKGGPNKGLFLQIVDEPDIDLAVPETGFTFRKLIKAQALADYLALKRRQRRVLRLNLKKDILGGLERLRYLIRNV